MAVTSGAEGLGFSDFDLVTGVIVWDLDVRGSIGDP